MTIELSQAPVTPTGSNAGRSLADWLGDRKNALGNAGIDPTGATDSTAGFIALLTGGGDIDIPKGDYLIAGKGADSGGIDVILTRSTRVRCHPDARFFTNNLDNDLIRFSVPGNGSGLPSEKISFEWFGGIFDQTNQRNSAVIPYPDEYPAAKPGVSNTCDGLSVRGAYTSGGVVRNALSLVHIKGVTCRAGVHWQTAGGDTGVYAGEGADLTIIEDNTFIGNRDLGVYGSWGGAGVAGGFIVVRKNTFINCFGAAAVKRSAAGFTISGNMAINCVTGFSTDWLVGPGIRGGSISDNDAVNCQISYRLVAATGSSVVNNRLRASGAKDASGGAIIVLATAPVGITLWGCTGCFVSGNVASGIDPLYSASTSVFLTFAAHTINGVSTLSTFNELSNNGCDGWRTLGSEPAVAANSNRLIRNRATNAVNPQFTTIQGTSYEVRVDPASSQDLFMGQTGFDDGSASRPSIRRRAQITTGVYFGTQMVGLSSGGVAALEVDPDRVRLFKSLTATASNALTASGTLQSDALPLTSDINTITNVENGTGVILPALIAGRAVTITNAGTNTLRVYPPNDASIDGLATNAPTVIWPGRTLRFHSAGTAWRSSGSQVAILASSGVATAPLTGTTAETVLETIAVPGGMMGLNGVLMGNLLASGTGSGTKTIRCRWTNATGSIICAPTFTGTQTQTEHVFRLQNRGAANSQIGKQSALAYGTSTGSLVTPTVDTSVDQVLVITGQLATASDSLTLESRVIELLAR